MPLILFHTRRVREALKAPAAVGIEALFLGLVGAAVGLIVMFGKEASRPFTSTVVIDLSYWSLPTYTLLSLARGFAAYVLSLIFTLIYGTIAAHNRRAEKLMIPALDILQAIPVLAFLPVVVLFMIQLFPSRELGLEMACVVTIFTAQVWNMTFSFHGSLRSIPAPLREVATLQRLSGWQIFRMLEVPAAMIGLVWNSMMSMAGGWFFLTVNEAFTLKDRDFRLPGIGSYMAQAMDSHAVGPEIAAVIAMVLMIVAVDQLFWRPIVVWSQRFKLEETADADKPQSWVLNLLQKSRIYTRLLSLFSKRNKRHAVVVRAVSRSKSPSSIPWNTILSWTIVIVLGAGSLWGAYQLFVLLFQLPLTNPSKQDWLHVGLALLASFGRTSAAVLIGAAWTLPVGIMIGLSPRWSQRLQPVIQVVASFPAPMLFPFVTLLLVFFGIPFNFGCIALMLLGAQWYILFNVIAGATAIPGDLKEVCTVYGTSRYQRWTKLYIPCVFPYLVTGLITAAGGAWNATIVAEYVEGGARTAFGLGSMIASAVGAGNYPLLAAGVVSMAIFVVIINRLIWKRLYHLAENRYSLNV